MNGSCDLRVNINKTITFKCIFFLELNEIETKTKPFITIEKYLESYFSNF